MVVVVSEERGAMSVAEGGRLHANLDRTSLRDLLLELLLLGRSGGETMRLLPRHPGTMALALVLAALVWYAQALDRRERISERQLDAPVTFVNVPAEMVITSEVPRTIVLRVRGPLSRLRALDAGADRRGHRPARRAARASTTSRSRPGTFSSPTAWRSLAVYAVAGAVATRDGWSAGGCRSAAGVGRAGAGFRHRERVQRAGQCPRRGTAPAARGDALP